MLKIKKNIIKKDLVLIGAGHANIEVIRYLGKLKLEGLRITSNFKNYNTTYSGMVLDILKVYIIGMKLI